jgi:DNA-binding NarL/FixJ family response regulator
MAGHVAAGASSFLSKTIGASELIAAVRVAADRTSETVAVSLPRSVLTEFLDDDGPVLTEDDAAVLARLRAGESNRQIAQALHVSEGTVKRRLSALYEKLGASSRLDAVRRSAENGI